MNEEYYSYLLGDETVEMPRNWVEIEELRSYAEELGFGETERLEEIFETTSIDVEDGKADFNQINLFILERGLISASFLTRLMNSKYGQDEYFEILELIDFLQGLNEFGPVEDDVEKVVSALKKLTS